MHFDQKDYEQISATRFAAGVQIEPAIRKPQHQSLDQAYERYLDTFLASVDRLFGTKLEFRGPDGKFYRALFVPASSVDDHAPQAIHAEVFLAFEENTDISRKVVAWSDEFPDGEEDSNEYERAVDGIFRIVDRLPRIGLLSAQFGLRVQTEYAGATHHLYQDEL